MTTLNDTQLRDVRFQLHPYTNAVVHQRTGPVVIDRGEGIYVYDDQGRQYLEAMAGLWSVAVGFGEQRLVDAATRQMQKLPYYHTFTHKSHTPAIELAERLIGYTDGRMAKAFFTNSGSEANDTVIKLVWYYNNALGRPDKKKIIARQRGYHGVTVASASLTGLAGNHNGFDLPLPRMLHTDCPHHYRNALPGESEEDYATRLAAQLEALITREGPDTIAAFIGEPVMGAGGVIVPPRTYWQKIQQVLRKYDILLVADEVINGFGRTGKLWACQTFDIQPDVLVTSKQLTSSYMPLAAIMITDEIYQAFADYTKELGTFGHGFTTSAHPVATAVGLENLKIIEERKLIEHAASVAPRFQEGLRRFADHPLVGEVRGVGLIAAVELVSDKKTKAGFEPVGSVGLHLFERCQANGLIVRNLGDIIAFCPPLIISEDEIDQLLERFGKSLEETAQWMNSRSVAAE